MMTDSSKWNDDDKALLESQLVLAMQPRLCLDPSPNILQTANKIQYHTNKWNHKGLKRYFNILIYLYGEGNPHKSQFSKPISTLQRSVHISLNSRN